MSVDAGQTAVYAGWQDTYLLEDLIGKVDGCLGRAVEAGDMQRSVAALVDCHQVGLVAE